MHCPVRRSAAQETLHFPGTASYLTVWGYQPCVGVETSAPPHQELRVYMCAWPASVREPALYAAASLFSLLSSLSLQPPPCTDRGLGLTYTLGLSASCVRVTSNHWDRGTPTSYSGARSTLFPAAALLLGACAYGVAPTHVFTHHAHQPPLRRPINPHPKKPKNVEHLQPLCCGSASPPRSARAAREFFSLGTSSTALPFGPGCPPQLAAQRSV
jgi:hypothetical protein